MAKDHIKELCTKYFVNNYQKIREEYLGYKAKFIDTLDFVNDTMLMMYEHAFFFHVTKIKASKKEFTGKGRYRMFLAALTEVKEKHVFAEEVEESKEILICNLYSILGS